MTGTLQSLFAWLDAEVGVVENPPHSNRVILRTGRNLWADYFGYQPPTSLAAWCALFQSVADWENGTPIPPIQFSKGFVGVDAGRAWFSSHGLLTRTCKPGYLAFYNEHVGRVRAYSGGSTFTAIEGNESDGVRIVTRSFSDIVGGFGVREYASAPPPPQEEDVPHFVQPKGDPRVFEVYAQHLEWVPNEGVLSYDSFGKGFAAVEVKPLNDPLWFRPELYVDTDGTVRAKQVTGTRPGAAS